MKTGDVHKFRCHFCRAQKRVADRLATSLVTLPPPLLDRLRAQAGVRRHYTGTGLFIPLLDDREMKAFLSLPPHSIFAIGLRFYIASRFESAEKVVGLAMLLKREGHAQTYDWASKENAYDPKDHPTVNETRMKNVSEEEINGVTSADVVIGWLPGGRGTHVEIGAALAAGKRVILCSGEALIDEPHQSLFYFHPGVQRIIEPNVGMRMYKAVQAVRELTVATRGDNVSRRETSTRVLSAYVGGVSALAASMSPIDDGLS